MTNTGTEQKADVSRALAVQGYMSSHELTWLAEQASRCSVVVEIGSWKGRSTRAMGDNVGRNTPSRRGRVYAVDHWLGQLRDPAAAPSREIKVQHNGDGSAVRKMFDANLADLVKSQRVVAVEHDSQLGVPQPLLRLVGKVDMLFVDGDHSYQGCRSDVEQFSLLVRDGGIICGHDYNNQVRHQGVRDCVEDLFGAAVKTHGTIWWVTK